MSQILHIACCQFLFENLSQTQWNVTYFVLQHCTKNVTSHDIEIMKPHAHLVTNHNVKYEKKHDKKKRIVTQHGMQIVVH
jgi:hypothetical protein